MPDNDNSILLEGVRIIFRNFAGRKGPYNDEGKRNFAVLLSPEMADELSNDGWNVKTTRVREGDYGETLGGEPYLGVKVSYGVRPPLCVMLTSRGRTNLGEDEVELLDFADIQTADLIINPYDWDVQGKSGKTAYLKSLFATIHEDLLELKYADVEVAGAKGSSSEFESDD